MSVVLYLVCSYESTASSASALQTGVHRVHMQACSWQAGGVKGTEDRG